MKDYKMTKLSYYDYCRLVMYSWKRLKSVAEIDDDLNEINTLIENEKFIEPHGLMLKFQNKYFEKGYLGDGNYWRLKNEYRFHMMEDDETSVFEKHFSKQDLLDYLGIIPFTPSVMINISPDWSESKLTTEFGRTTVLKKLIDSYMLEQWYEKWEYVIENGSDGKHIHAHIVAKMNTKRLKSTESHLKKGNNTQQLKKHAKGIKGIQGCIKGNSVQKVFIRTEEIEKDKLLYLHEDTKPIGHKNKSAIVDGHVVGCL